MSASKRGELIEKALDIFYRDGFHATGMDKLVAETGISKTSMYKHFRTKDDLIVATLRLRDENFLAFFASRASELADTPKEQLLATFDVLRDWIASDAFNSCMFIKASSEFLDPKHPARAEASRHKAKLQVYLTDLAKQAGLKNPADLARQLQILQEGAITLAHIQGPATYAQDAKAAAELLINNHQ